MRTWASRSREATGSREEVGSSSRSTSGPVASVRARHMRWASPPDRSSARRSRNERSSPARSRAAAAPPSSRPRAGDAKVLEDGARERRRPLEHHPDPSSVGQRLELGDVVAPEADPARRRHVNRLQRRSSVDLPAPDGPASTVMPSSGSVRSMPSRMVRPDSSSRTRLEGEQRGRPHRPQGMTPATTALGSVPRWVARGHRRAGPGRPWLDWRRSTRARRSSSASSTSRRRSSSWWPRSSRPSRPTRW